MNWVLFLGTIFLLFIFYFLGKKFLLSPPFVATLSVSVSSFVLAVNTNYWNYSVSLTTIVIILFSLVSFGSGFYLITSFQTRYLPSQNRRNLCFYRTSNKRIEIKTPSTIVYLFALSFVTITLVLYFLYQRQRAAAFGMSYSLESIVYANRYYSESGTASWIKLMLTVSKIIVLFSIFIFFYNAFVLRTFKRGLLTLLLSGVYLLCCALTTNRIDLINIASMVLFIVFFLWQYSQEVHHKKKNLIPVLVVTFLAVLIMIVLFRAFGWLTGKSAMYSAYDNISLYVGSPIVCLDKYVRGTAGISSDFNIQLFSHLYLFLNSFGFDIPITSSVWPFQYWSNGASNIYSSFFPYLVKFGAIGTFIVEFIIGVFIGTLYSHMYRSRNNWILVLICANFFYVLTMYSIAERFFDQLFTATALIEILFIILFWFVSQNKLSHNEKLDYAIC